MSYATVIFLLRQQKGLTQTDVARRAGVLSQSEISHIERRLKLQPAGNVQLALDRVLALGEPRNGERDPHYVLASVGEGRFVLARTAANSLGIFRNYQSAELAQSMIQLAGPQIDVVPLWAGYAALDVDGRGDDLSVVDRELGGLAQLRAICAHALLIAEVALATDATNGADSISGAERAESVERLARELLEGLEAGSA